MRRWLSALFATVMLLGINGVVSASSGNADSAICRMTPAVCATMASGGGCTCCGTPTPAVSDACRTPGSQCERSTSGGTRLDLFDQQRVTDTTVEAARNSREPQPWPATFAVASGRADTAKINQDLPGWSEDPPVASGGRDRLARIRMLRI